MNIFILDNDPKLSAQYHSDKHCVKMVLETAQILCSAFPKGEAPYKQTHVNHPSCVWARQSQDNYLWLISLGKELGKEYTYRYGKTHKSVAVISWCEQNINKIAFPQGEMTSFAQAMPDDYVHMDAVEAYRNYYRYEKHNINKWEKSRTRPNWL
tara:strand:+ start:4859 stop:5320 length:462 start_codon:yes stop_codon:yes gene_type:complete